MKKRFLLTAGDGYYPCAGDEDWVGFFETREEAQSCVSETPDSYYKDYKITVNGYYRDVDWYRIIDTENWELDCSNWDWREVE